jgi:hypothetical protein
MSIFWVIILKFLQRLTQLLDLILSNNKQVLGSLKFNTRALSSVYDLALRPKMIASLEDRDVLVDRVTTGALGEIEHVFRREGKNILALHGPIPRPQAP